MIAPIFWRTPRISKTVRDIQNSETIGEPPRAYLADGNPKIFRSAKKSVVGHVNFVKIFGVAKKRF